MALANIPIYYWVSVGAILIFGCWWCGFYWTHTRTGYFFFDPQDFAADMEQTGRVRKKLPKSAQSATFEPLLKHYIGVTQLLITVAAASIAFAGSVPKPHMAIAAAKLLLAWSIAFGVVFCALLLWRYDEYGQNMESYTPPWYATIFAAGFSCLCCFMFGYLVWAFGLAN